MFFKRQKLLILKLRISEYKNRYFLILHILVNPSLKSGGYMFKRRIKSLFIILLFLGYN